MYDAIGNVAQRLDATGQVKSADQYDAWGNLVAGGDASDPYGYKGKFGYYADHETGLVLCTHRYYDPIAGRWLTRDPIGVAGGVNLYGYCKNSSINLIDELGYYERGIPLQGPPGGEDWRFFPNGNSKQYRGYKDNGFPRENIDWGHNHGAGDPHRHKWGPNGRCPGEPIPDSEALPVPPGDGEPIEIDPKPLAIGGGVIAAILIWEAGKWTIAAIAAIPTGGGSLALALVTP